MRAILALTLAVVLAAPAAAQVQAPAKPQTRSLDSDAPPDAPPHWLPSEQWVMQHWIPYDEARLYRLLGVARGDVWRRLRDDTRTLADLARERGWEPRDLARELVAPWRGKLREPRRLATLESRALRTLTQGHLSQHLFFHSLHQDAIPDAAPAIFGVSSRAEFQGLRRAELSPLQICRLNGLSRAHAQGRAARTLAAMAAKGVHGQAIPAVQARRLLRRQLRQVPRWLSQTRYNGPPPLKQPRASIATASNYSNNAAISADGAAVVYESYEAALPSAKRRGEIGIRARAAGAAPALVSAPTRGRVRRTPRSAYNPAVSADGRWVAFESAEGNLNFAKRYGEMGVYVRDLRDGVTRLASRPARGPGGKAIPRSAYNPTLSGDGRVIAYESSESRRGDLDVYVADTRGGASRRVTPPRGAAGDVYEPQLSADGRRLAFTALARGARAASTVYVRDLRAGRTRAAFAGTGDAYEPVLSGDGRFVAFTAAAADGAARRTRVLVRDLRTGATTQVAPRPGDGLDAGAWASEPSISGDGRRVAFTARGPADRRSSVYVADLAAGTTALASRAGGADGPPAAGSASHPALAADGRRVAFTSDAWNLAPAKCNGARGIFVRDLERATTRLVSVGDGANRYLGPTKGSSSGGDMLVALVCA